MNPANPSFIPAETGWRCYYLNEKMDGYGMRLVVGWVLQECSDDSHPDDCPGGLCSGFAEYGAAIVNPDGTVADAWDAGVIFATRGPGEPDPTNEEFAAAVKDHAEWEARVAKADATREAEPGQGNVHQFSRRPGYGRAR